ncbi:MAG TPA: hypothetical protein VIJ85_09225 [Rhizomicrobium sp.]
MRLVLSIAAAWMFLDFVAGKVVTGVLGPIDAALWHTISQAVANS